MAIWACVLINLKHNNVLAYAIFGSICNLLSEAYINIQ